MPNLLDLFWEQLQLYIILTLISIFFVVFANNDILCTIVRSSFGYFFKIKKKETYSSSIYGSYLSSFIKTRHIYKSFRACTPRGISYHEYDWLFMFDLPIIYANIVFCLTIILAIAIFFKLDNNFS